MEVRLIASCSDPAEKRQHLTTFVINDSIAIDAGSLGLMSPLAAQSAVRHVLLSHSHIDHIATLSAFIDNVYSPEGPCPRIYAGRPVWDCLNRDLFNDRLWPDLDRLASLESRFYTAVVMETEKPITIDNVRITPVSVNHLVPTLGFLVEDDQAAIVIASDTGPTQRLWERAGQPDFRRKLRAVFLECSFPDSMAALATTTKHLCTSTFAGEIAKLTPQPAFDTIVVHLKPGHHQIIAAELGRLPIPRLRIATEAAGWSF